MIDDPIMLDPICLVGAVGFLGWLLIEWYQRKHRPDIVYDEEIGPRLTKRLSSRRKKAMRIQGHLVRAGRYLLLGPLLGLAIAIPLTLAYIIYFAVIYGILKPLLESV